jgi:hypothetical protein
VIYRKDLKLCPLPFLLAKGPVITIIVLVLMLAYEEFESRVIVPVVYGRALRLPSSVVLFSLIEGATLLGIVGALLALPVAAAILMLIEELRVELPGEIELGEDAELRKRDDRGEQEYERRTEGMPAEQAAAIAVEMSDERKKKEVDPHVPPEAPLDDGKRGCEVYENVKEIKRDIKSIFMIGHANDIIQSKRLFQDGMEFVSKPVLSNELESKGRETLDA